MDWKAEWQLHKQKNRPMSKIEKLNFKVNLSLAQLISQSFAATASKNFRGKIFDFVITYLWTEIIELHYLLSDKPGHEAL